MGQRAKTLQGSDVFIVDNILQKELNDCFPVLRTLLTGQELDEFRALPLKRAGIYHIRFGLMLRLKLLGRQTRLYRAFVAEGVHSREMMANRIILAFYMHLQAEAEVAAEAEEEADDMEQAL